MTFNGLDLLFVLIGLILLFVLMEIYIRFSSWSEWDRDRRRGRTYHLWQLKINQEEDAYRAYLRRLLVPSLQAATHRATRAIQKFNKAFALTEAP